jgi:hypothetical protein
VPATFGVSEGKRGEGVPPRRSEAHPDPKQSGIQQQ